MTESSEFSGKVAVITGGSRGIGKAVAAALVARGAHVVIGDVLDEEGEATAEELNKQSGSKVASFLRTDVTTYKDLVALFELAEKEFGGVDIAFLNAGISGVGSDPFSPLDDEMDELIVNVNLMGVIKGTKVAIRHMAKRGGGTIVNTASFYGFCTTDSVSSYAATKHAVIGYTRSFKTLPQVCNVRVNAVCPYYCDTDIIGMTKEIPEDQLPPMGTLVKKLPRVTLQTVVAAVLRLIQDKSLNAQALLALPGDAIQAVGLPLELDVEKAPEVIQAYKDYERTIVPYHRTQLQDALHAHKL
ncbi:hypothetical protein BCR43DRAFT_486444 [Syncephalastrum racemosum]|uniref:NAD(P)-binding protein n=1 Tax=Syncephalastrum racemosum TaxID=13706 RepID=A0A1X2HP30_SYNRA|nr:hypothetical protein BCR43DRAFT_486444 [Syncephalastrum racemosum]